MIILASFSGCTELYLSSKRECSFYIDEYKIYISTKNLKRDFTLIKFGRADDNYTDSIIINAPNVETQLLEIFIPSQDSEDIYILDPYKQIEWSTNNRFLFHPVHEFEKKDGHIIWPDSILYNKDNVTIKLGPHKRGFCINKGGSFVRNAIQI